MPTFTFQGFTTGSAVTLAAAQGSNSASNSVASWGFGNLGSVSIQKTQTDTPVAPAGLWLEAIDIAGFAANGGPGPGEVYDPSFHEITFVWTVRGQPLAPFTAPENMVTGWNNPNVAYGKKVAFAFPDPGTYTIDLWMVDAQGTTGVAETTMTVANPDSLYVNSRTICFSNMPGETWAGEKPGCVRATTVAALQAAVDNAALPPRILLKRGLSVSNFRLFIDEGKLGYLGAWGAGADPIVTPPHRQSAVQTWNDATMPDLTIADIHFQGRWDSTTETGVPDLSPTNFRVNAADQFYLLYNCRVDGFQSFWPDGGKTADYTTIVANCSVTNWRDYGMYVQYRDAPGARIAIFGTKLAQHPDALNGGQKNGLFNTHGPLRMGGNSGIYVAQCDLFSRCGWSFLGADRADQPCIRLNFDTDPGSFVTIERVICEGGFRPISLSGQDNGEVEDPGNYLLDKILCVGSAKTIKQFIVLEFGGTTVRNMVGIMPNVPPYHTSNPWVAGALFGMDNPTLANSSEPVALYSSTFLNLWDAQNDPGWNWEIQSGVDVFSNYTVENNVLHAADMDTATTPNGPIDTVTEMPGVTLRYKGVRYNFDTESGSFGGTVTSGSNFTLPYPEGTNQAYWQAIQSTDTLHSIFLGSDDYHASLGQLTVSFEASQVRITNTSGSNWSGNWNLRLDRKSMIPAMVSNYASPAKIPVPHPQTGSSALGGAALGAAAYHDFFGAARPNPPSAGALEQA